jgi:glycerol-3-phosphate acyltransferase PlsY
MQPKKIVILSAAKSKDLPPSQQQNHSLNLLPLTSHFPTPYPPLLLNSTPKHMTLWLLTLTTAYLLGSIPFGYLLVRVFRKEDVRATGSGNIGATNVARAGGTTLGLLTLFFDALKGYVAVLIAMHLAPNTAQGPSPFAAIPPLAIAAAVAAVIGHVFPIWLRFRGGKGIATALGVFIALVPLVALASVGVFALIVATTRLVSLGSILAAVSIPLFALWLVPHRSAALLAGLSFISLLSIIKHHANIVRLLRGTESRFGSKKNSPDNSDSNEKKVNA